jgi:hypothetical protein
MKRYFLPALLFFLSAPSFSQTVNDVIRYSYLHPSGTARYVGAGSAMGALGADFGTLSGNPAGLALFRASELTVTPSLHIAHTEAALPDNFTVDESRTTFGFDNLGLVFNTTPKGGRWKTFNVGIGFNRMNNFNQSIYYYRSAGGTIMNGFYAEASSVFNSGGSEDDLNPFGAQLAWDANAIYFQDNVLTYDFAGYENAEIDRSHLVTTFGSMNEMVFSFAGNYNEQLMVGATIGVPFVNYRLESEYTEEDPGGDVDGAVPYFGRLVYTDYLRTEGVGINFKMGLIYKINQMFRLGVAFHTPTSLSLTDNYSNTFIYDYGDGGGSYMGERQLSPDGIFDYKLRTPWRVIVSGGAIVKKHGFISADVEWLDYGTNRYNFSSTNEDEAYERELNADIQRAYRSAMNIRVGGELALDEFRLRAGVNLNGNPNEGMSDFNTGFSAGAGVRLEGFFIDLAYRYLGVDGYVSPYEGAPQALTDYSANDISLTIGFKF